jgi:hypothetical protein
MDEVQQRRALAVITPIESALERGVQHFDRSGKRLNEVSSIIAAWAHGGLTVKEPENHQLMESWIRQ